MRYLIIIILILAIPKLSGGQDLNDYLIQAAENNPGLQASYHEYLAVLEKIPQAGGLPDPELSAGIFINPMSRFMGNQIADIRLTQQFPWFGTLKTKKNDGISTGRIDVFSISRSEKSAFFSWSRALGLIWS